MTLDLIFAAFIAVLMLTVLAWHVARAASRSIAFRGDKTPPTLDDEWARHQQKADAAERALLLASPTGWLLDPFRFPTDPHAVRIEPPRIDPIKEIQAQQAMILTGVMVPHRPQATMRMKISIPDCPACGSGYTEIGAEHGGTASLYWCHTCHAEFTDKGETRKSKRRRKALDDVMNELPEPPAYRD